MILLTATISNSVGHWPDDPSHHPGYKTKNTYWSTAGWQVPEWTGQKPSASTQEKINGKRKKSSADATIKLAVPWRS